MSCGASLPRVSGQNCVLWKELRVNLCRTCVDFKKERDFYKERCRIYERQIETLYKQLNGGGNVFNLIPIPEPEAVASRTPRIIQNITDTYAVIEPLPLVTVPVAASGYVIEESGAADEEYVLGHHDTTVEPSDEEGEEEPRGIQEPLSVVKVKMEPDEAEENAVPGDTGASKDALKCCWVLNGDASTPVTCGKEIAAWSDFTPHMRIAHKLHPHPWQKACLWRDCPRNGQPFSRTANLMKHVVKAHAGEAWRKCPNQGCGQSFAFANDLESHKKSCDERLAVLKRRYDACPMQCAGLFDEVRTVAPPARDEDCQIQVDKEETRPKPANDMTNRIRKRLKNILKKTKSPQKKQDDQTSTEKDPKPLQACRKLCAEKVSGEAQLALFREYWDLKRLHLRRMYLESRIELKLRRQRANPKDRRCRKHGSSKKFKYLYYVWLKGDRVEVCGNCFRGIFGETAAAIDQVAGQKLACLSVDADKGAKKKSARNG